jgi:Tetratricopeptide repeat
VADQETPEPQSLVRIGSSMTMRQEITFVVLSVVTMAILLLGLGWIVLQMYRGVAWMAAEVYAHGKAVGWVLVVVILIWLAIEVRARCVAISRPDSARTRRGSLWSAIVLAALVIAGNGCLNIAASKVEAFWERRKNEGVQIYQNHDLAQMVGQCIKLAILRLSDSQEFKDSPQRSALVTLANLAPARWKSTSDQWTKSKDPQVKALLEPKLVNFIRDKDAMALSVTEWVDLLTLWKDSDSKLTAASIESAARVVARDFGVTLREALKADFSMNGKAWASMQLDIAGELMRLTLEASTARTKDMVAAIDEFKAILEGSKDTPPALESLRKQVELAVDPYAKDVLEQFDRFSLSLTWIDTKVEVIGMVVAQTQQEVKGLAANVIETHQSVKDAHADIKDLKKSMSDAADGMATLVAERLEIVLGPHNPQGWQNGLAILSAATNMKPSRVRATPMSAETMAAVEREYRSAPLIDRYAALVRAGHHEAADALTAEIERCIACRSPEEQYAYFLARGDRHWLTNNFKEASEWFPRAMRIRSDDPYVAARVGESAEIASRGVAHQKRQDLEEALGWVTDSSAKLRADPDATAAEIARLEAARAALLQALGRPAEAQKAAEGVIAELKSGPPASEPVLWSAQMVLARALQAQNIGPQAVAAANDAMALAKANPQLHGWAEAETAVARVAIGESDPATIVADAERAIQWAQQQPEQAPAELSALQASKAGALQSLGKHEEAAQAYTQAITLAQQADGDTGAQSSAQSGADRRVPMYANRGRAHAKLKKFAEAEADLTQSIELRQRQQDPDQLKLMSDYTERADALREQGKLEQAERDADYAIAGLLKLQKTVRDELRRALDVRASIRKKRGNPSGAEVDLRAMRKEIEPGSPDSARQLATSSAHLADVLVAQGKTGEANAEGKKTQEYLDTQISPDPELEALHYRTLGGIQLEGQDPVAAAASFTKAIEVLGPSNEATLAQEMAAKARRATAYQHQGILDLARTEIDEAIVWLEAQTPRDELLLAQCYASRASICYLIDGNDGELNDIDRAIEWLSRQPNHNERELMDFHATRADVLYDLGTFGRALDDVSRSIDWFSKQAAPEHRRLATYRRLRSLIHRNEKRWSDAEVDLLEAVSHAKQATPANVSLLALCTEGLAKVRDALGRTEEAEKGISEAIALEQSLPSPDADRLAGRLVFRATVRHDLSQEVDTTKRPGSDQKGEHLRDALADIDQAIRLASESNPAAHLTRATVLNSMERYAEAMEQVQEAVRQYDESKTPSELGRAPYLAARALIALNLKRDDLQAAQLDIEASIQAFLSAPAGEESRLARYRTTYAKILLARKDYANAQVAIEQALEMLNLNASQNARRIKEADGVLAQIKYEAGR